MKDKWFDKSDPMTDYFLGSTMLMSTLGWSWNQQYEVTA